MIRRLLALFVVLAIGTGLVTLFPGAPTEQKIYAQFSGAALPPGYFASASNQFAQAAIGSAGTVTNPASNFLMNVQGGPLYCPSTGAEQVFGNSLLQLAASNTYLLVWNCATQLLYAKTAVTGPGSGPGAGGTGVGIPASILFPIPNVEVALATVVCNATACGNGGNGSITDNRPLAAFPAAGVPVGSVTFANLPAAPDGSVVICSSCTQPTTGSAACTTGAVAVLAARVAGAWRCF